MKMTDPAAITPAQQANREELRTRIREQRYETIPVSRWRSLEHCKYQRPKRKEKLPACFIDAAANTAYIIARRTTKDLRDWPGYDQALTDCYGVNHTRIAAMDMLRHTDVSLSLAAALFTSDFITQELYSSSRKEWHTRVISAITKYKDLVVHENDDGTITVTRQAAKAAKYLPRWLADILYLGAYQADVHWDENESPKMTPAK